MHTDERAMKRFLATIERLPVQISIEVGAFDADYSRQILEDFPGVEVYAFEASPFVHQRFRAQLPDGMHYEHLAISDVCGVARFQVQAEFEDHSLVGNNSINRRLEKKEYLYVEVPCDSLDRIFPAAEGVSLWIDAEGANKEVLLGAEKLLQRTVAIFIETEHREFWEGEWTHSAVAGFLARHGFSMAYISEQYPFQTNAIFVRDEYLARVRYPLGLKLYASILLLVVKTKHSWLRLEALLRQILALCRGRRADESRP